MMAMSRTLNFILILYRLQKIHSTQLVHTSWHYLAITGSSHIRSASMTAAPEFAGWSIQSAVRSNHQRKHLSICQAAAALLSLSDSYRDNQCNRTYSMAAGRALCGTLSDMCLLLLRFKRCRQLEGHHFALSHCPARQSRRSFHFVRVPFASQGRPQDLARLEWRLGGVSPHVHNA